MNEPTTQTLVRSYKSKNQPAASRAFAKDAAFLSQGGWSPVAQSWEQGKSGCLRFIVTLGLSAWVLKPAGSLTVTYTRKNPWAIR